MTTDIRTRAFTVGPYPPATFGANAVDRLPDLVRRTGSDRVALVSDRGLTATPLPDRIAALLRDHGLPVGVFGGVHPNPTLDDVTAGGAVVRAMGPGTAVVPLGGGSALDAAKAIALAAANDRPAAELAWGDAPGLSPALPIVAVPTTAGTGSECNDLAVVTDPATRRKCYLGGPSCLARHVILDPALTVGLPPRPTAASGIDCLTHAVESFLSVNANPWADGLDLQAVRLVAANLPRAVADGADLAARSHLLLAAPGRHPVPVRHRRDGPAAARRRRPGRRGDGEHAATGHRHRPHRHPARQPAPTGLIAYRR